MKSKKGYPVRKHTKKKRIRDNRGEKEITASPSVVFTVARRVRGREGGEKEKDSGAAANASRQQKKISTAKTAKSKEGPRWTTPQWCSKGVNVNLRRGKNRPNGLAQDGEAKGRGRGPSHSSTRTRAANDPKNPGLVVARTIGCQKRKNGRVGVILPSVGGEQRRGQRQEMAIIEKTIKTSLRDGVLRRVPALWCAHD